MKTTVTQWGNSLAIRIPKPFAAQMGIAHASEVEIGFEDNKIVIYKPKYSLDDLLKKVTPQNIHEETDFGTPSGKEIW